MTELIPLLLLSDTCLNPCLDSEYSRLLPALTIAWVLATLVCCLPQPLLKHLLPLLAAYLGYSLDFENFCLS